MKLTKWKQVQKLPVGTKVLIIRPPLELEVANSYWSDGEVYLSGPNEVAWKEDLKEDIADGCLFYVIK
jgi:hypothetical protein